MLAARTLTPSKKLDRDEYLLMLGRARYGRGDTPCPLPISNPSKEKAKQKTSKKNK